MLYFMMALCIVDLVDSLLLPSMVAFNVVVSVLFLLIGSGMALATESLPNASQSVSEIRAFLLAAHIPEVTASALADWEAVAMGGRCSSPFPVLRSTADLESYIRYKSCHSPVMVLAL